MNKLKESILNDVKKVGGDTTNASNETINGRNETTSSNNNTTTRSNDAYVYGVGILAVLTIGACVFFTYQLKNKKQDNDRPTAQHEQKKDQPPKRRHML